LQQLNIVCAPLSAAWQRWGVLLCGLVSNFAHLFFNNIEAKKNERALKVQMSRVVEQQIYIVHFFRNLKLPSKRRASD
jgi:hypothetical protein